MQGEAVEARARRWLQENPHRRWFLDYYNLPPTDPRYLELTDEEIAFDFYSVKAKKEAAQDEQWNDDVFESTTFKSIEEARIANLPVAPGQAKQTLFQSDEAEFKTWYEENIGPWTP